MELSITSLSFTGFSRLLVIDTCCMDDWHLSCWFYHGKTFFSYFLFFHVWRWTIMDYGSCLPSKYSPYHHSPLSPSFLSELSELWPFFSPSMPPPSSAVLRSLSSYPILWQTTYDINLEKGQFQLALVSDVYFSPVVRCALCSGAFSETAHHSGESITEQSHPSSWWHLRGRGRGGGGRHHLIVSLEDGLQWPRLHFLEVSLPSYGSMLQKCLKHTVFVFMINYVW